MFPSKFIYFFPVILLLLVSACSPGSQSSAEAVSLATNTPEQRATLTPAPPSATDIPPTVTIQEATATDTPPSANPITYTIDPERSEVRFYIDELLFGEPKTVIGRTNELTGEVEVDINVPSAASIGLIEINALALTTDDSFRNRALRSQILQSNRPEYQNITFSASTIRELPAQAQIGEAYAIQVVGDLTIREISQEVTFDLIVTPESDSSLVGEGTALVSRADFDLTIPQVTGVAEVSDQVRLEIDFVAVSGVE